MDGVRSVQPTMFGDYFTLQLNSRSIVGQSEVPIEIVTSLTINATVTVFGIADTGLSQPAYDACYAED